MWRSEVTVLLTRMFSVNLPDGGETPGRRDSVTSVFQDTVTPRNAPFSGFCKSQKNQGEEDPYVRRCHHGPNFCIISRRAENDNGIKIPSTYSEAVNDPVFGTGMAGGCA